MIFVLTSLRQIRGQLTRKPRPSRRYDTVTEMRPYDHRQPKRRGRSLLLKHPLKRGQDTVSRTMWRRRMFAERRPRRGTRGRRRGCEDVSGRLRVLEFLNSVTGDNPAAITERDQPSMNSEPAFTPADSAHW